MRILLVGDLHYNLRQLDWVLDAAADHDLVVLVGDLLDISSSVPVEAQVPVVLRYLEQLAAKGPTISSSGNHDLTGRDGNGEKAPLWLSKADTFGVLTDYSSTVVGGSLITVCPWWDGPKGHERVAAFLAEQAAEFAEQEAIDRWIWVYHWPPPDSPVSWTGKQFYGDADLAAWIEQFQPSLVLTGHVHQAPMATGGSWIASSGDTWVINAGNQIGPVPTYAVVDLDSWEASWHSFDEIRKQAL